MCSSLCFITINRLYLSYVTEEQRKVAMIAEMIHTGSLIHDDVVDVSSMRRGKSTVNEVWGERNVSKISSFFTYDSLILFCCDYHHIDAVNM